MADVRALLRQQRTARRIDHPHAVYSDSGKLSCSVCHELIRPESAWDGHLRGALHRQNVRALQAQKASASPDLSNGDDAQPPHKRRHSETDDGDVEMGSDGEDAAPSRKKQHRPSTDSPKPTIEIKSPADTDKPLSRRGSGEPRKLSLSTQQQLTPPLGRRSSGTPAQGVEMRIPSRPATPIAHKDSFLGVSGSGSNSESNSGAAGLPSATSTPKMAPLGRSPLIPQEALAAATAALPATAILPDAATAARTSTATGSTPALGISQAEIDEDEWAAFEAEVVNAPAAAEAARPGTKPDMNGGLVASAGAVSAEELAAVDGEDDRAKRRAAEEAQLADEKEEATRALQDEFEDMQELESRVQKLKEKREALRNQTTQPQQPAAQQALAPPAVIDGAAARRPSATMIDKENIRQQLAATHNGTGSKGQAVAESSDEDDDDEDEEDADWEVFRFRG